MDRTEYQTYLILMKCIQATSFNELGNRAEVKIRKKCVKIKLLHYGTKIKFLNRKSFWLFNIRSRGL